MPSTTRTDGPRHMAGRPHRSTRTQARSGPAVTALPPSADPAEIPLVAQVPRSRLAFALAVTVAALPVLALDNFPATAEPSVRVEAVGHEVAATEAPTTTAAPTTTTEAPTTTVAPPTTEAPAPTIAPSPEPTAAAARTVPAPRPTPTTAPPTTQAPVAPARANGDPNDPATWDRMAQCEAGGNWAANTGNGYYGGLQFSLGTWQAYGGTGYPHEASKATQIEIGKRLQAAKGWGAWPGCARELGYT